MGSEAGYSPWGEIIKNFRHQDKAFITDLIGNARRSHLPFTVARC